MNLRKYFERLKGKGNNKNEKNQERAIATPIGSIHEGLANASMHSSDSITDNDNHCILSSAEEDIFEVATAAEEPVHILLVGPAASAKTVFMRSLVKLSSSYFTHGTNTTKVGMIDYIFENRPKYLLIDEIDKMQNRDQAFLLNLMETGIVSETKYQKARNMKAKIWVFAGGNNSNNLIQAMRSRFFIIKLDPYTYQQFSEIKEQMLMLKGIGVEITKATADAVRNKIRSGNIRDCIRIARMAKSLEDVNIIVNTYLKYGSTSSAETRQKYN
jgi:holliday junction DNA helicase RuvB